MSRYPILEKTIHGTKVSQDDFKRAICEALAGMDGGAGKVRDLIPFVGTEWDAPEGRKLLGLTLANMARRGTLKHDPVKRGVYAIAPRFTRIGVSVRDQNEKSIVESIRKRGGFARFSEIMDDFGLRFHGPELQEWRARLTRKHYRKEQDEDFISTVYDPRNTTGYHQLREILAHSQIIRQDYPFVNETGQTTSGGWYNLPLDELNQMTLRGRFASIIARSTHAELNLRGTYIDERDDHFTRVGSVYNAARTRQFTSEEFVSRQPVADALLALARDPVIARENNSFYQGETRMRVDEMIASGASKASIDAYREGRRNSRKSVQAMIDIAARHSGRRDSSDAIRVLVGMLERFENGGGIFVGTNLHLRAPVSFYEALAKELGIDPVGASRGFLQPDTRGERVRLHRPQADWERLGELDAERGRFGKKPDDDFTKGVGILGDVVLKEARKKKWLGTTDEKEEGDL